ncbi:hypothetical protein [Actinophytocola sp.]
MHGGAGSDRLTGGPGADDIVGAADVDQVDAGLCPTTASTVTWTVL